MYAASAADQLAIFDLGEFNDIDTQERLAAHRTDGSFSDEALNEQRANQGEPSCRFEAIRVQRSQPPGFDQEGTTLLTDALPVELTGSKKGKTITIKVVGKAFDDTHPTATFSTPKANGGAKYMATVAESFMQGTVKVFLALHLASRRQASELSTAFSSKGT